MEASKPEHSSDREPGSQVSGVAVRCSVVGKLFVLPKRSDPMQVSAGRDALAPQRIRHGHSVGQPA